MRVRELVFPVDFYVLDMTSDTRLDDSLILGRPFMKTAKMVIRDRKSTRLNSSHSGESRMPSSA